ncbi:MAG: MFS transporter [Frankia sp.]|nr:MFS transporter [Frankia sp.]
MPFYPLYALLFADSGVSPARISALFALWSLTAFVLEVPSGVWADVLSRRRLVAAGPAVDAAGYALWALVPTFWAFAAGFVLIGTGGALRSGALQALVHAELDRVGAPGAYPRLIGRYQAVGSVSALLATALAAPLVAAGGYVAVAGLSVLALLGAAAVGATLPEPPRTAAAGGAGGDDGDDTGPGSHWAVLTAGVRVVRGSAPVRRALLLLAALTVVPALEEYTPLLARDTGAGEATVPLLVLLLAAGAAAGGLAAGHGGDHRLAPALAVAAVLLGVGAASRHPAGIVAVAAAFAVFFWALAHADARLQDRLDDATRATVTSMSSVGMEAVSIATFAAYAAGSAWLPAGALFALAAPPYLLLAATAARGRRR